MADTRALDALRRVEQALTRVEAAAARPVPPAAADPPEDHQRLRAAHDTLRRRVAGAIGQIDRLIENGERR